MTLYWSGLVQVSNSNVINLSYLIWLTHQIQTTDTQLQNDNNPSQSGEIINDHTISHTVDYSPGPGLPSRQSRRPQQHIPPRLRIGDLLIEQHLKILDKLDTRIEFTHVKEASVSPHHHIIMCQHQRTTGSSRVARDGTYGRHGEREEIGDDAAEVIWQAVVFTGRGGADPGLVEPIGEELALGAGDESGVGRVGGGEEM